MKRLLAIESPSSFVARSVASTSSGLSPSSANVTASMICFAGNARSGTFTMKPDLAFPAKQIIDAVTFALDGERPELVERECHRIDDLLRRECEIGLHRERARHRL